MRHISVLPYYFPDALLRLSGSGNAASEGLFMLGAAAGFLILCSLLRLWIYGNLDRKALPPREYRCRMAAVFSILAAALGLCVPFFPGFAGITVPAGSMIQFLGLLGFELSLGLLLLIRQFPLWGWRQLLPLPLLCAAALLLPLWGLRAPLSLGGFSLVLCLLCVSLFAWLVKQGQNGRPFFQGILIFLPLGLSFVLPLGRGAFFWPAAFLAYLLLEHRFLPGGASSSTPLFLPPPLTVTVEGVSAGRPKTRSPSPAAGKGSVQKAPVQKPAARKAPVKKTPAKKSSAAPSIKTNKTKSAAGAKAAKAKPAAKTKSAAITKNAAKTKTAPASVKAKPAAAGRTGTKTAAGAKSAAKTKTAASVKAKPAAAPKPAAAAMAAKKPETVEELTELTELTEPEASAAVSAGQGSAAVPTGPAAGPVSVAAAGGPAVHVPAGAPPADLPAGGPSVASFIPREFLAILNKKTVADLKLGDHIKQEMTIFFSDLRQFTELSENLTPEESFAFINSYLSRIVPEITKNGGFVDKYIGDAILALFPQGGGADMAVRTAIAIQEKIQEYNFHRAKCGYRPLSMGIGLHTGTLMVGVVGTQDRMQSTVISDAVNLASRVESLTKAFRVSLAISEETFKKLEDPGAYQYRFVGKVRVKGKSEPVSIFEIFDGIDEKLQKRKVQANRFFEQGMFLYYQKKYTDALQDFRKVLEILPNDGASAFYIDNCLTKIKI